MSKSFFEVVTEALLAGPRWVEQQVTADSVQNAREAATEASMRRTVYDQVGPKIEEKGSDDLEVV